MEPLGDDDGGVGQVVLLGLGVEEGADLEVAAELTVEEANEDGGGVKVRKAEAVDGAVFADEGGGVHVADERVVLAWSMKSSQSVILSWGHKMR